METSVATVLPCVWFVALRPVAGPGQATGQGLPRVRRGRNQSRRRLEDCQRGRRRFSAEREEAVPKKPPLHYLCSVPVWPSGDWLPLSYFERAKQGRGGGFFSHKIFFLLSPVSRNT